MAKDKKDDVKEETTPTMHSPKDTFQNILDKVIEMGNKKYGFSFSLNGWVIAALGLLLLILVLK